MLESSLQSSDNVKWDVRFKIDNIFYCETFATCYINDNSDIYYNTFQL